MRTYRKTVLVDGAEPMRTKLFFRPRDFLLEIYRLLDEHHTTRLAKESVDPLIGQVHRLQVLGETECDDTLVVACREILQGGVYVTVHWIHGVPRSGSTRIALLPGLPINLATTQLA